MLAAQSRRLYRFCLSFTFVHYRHLVFIWRKSVFLALGVRYFKLIIVLCFQCTAKCLRSGHTWEVGSLVDACNSCDHMGRQCREAHCREHTMLLKFDFQLKKKFFHTMRFLSPHRRMIKKNSLAENAQLE